MYGCINADLLTLACQKALSRALGWNVLQAFSIDGHLATVIVSPMQGSYFNLTQEWLVRHRYPPGPIHLTKTHLPTLPIYYSVGNFKVDYMESLKARGLDIYAAYGNTTTDIRAYAAFGIPKVGPQASARLQASSTWHLLDVRLWGQCPQAWSRKGLAGPAACPNGPLLTLSQ